MTKKTRREERRDVVTRRDADEPKEPTAKQLREAHKALEKTGHVKSFADKLLESVDDTEPEDVENPFKSDPTELELERIARREAKAAAKIKAANKAHAKEHKGESFAERLHSDDPEPESFAKKLERSLDK